jgi:hypothetical protein
MAFTGLRAFLLLCCFGATSLYLATLRAPSLDGQPSADVVSAAAKRSAEEISSEIETVAVDAVRQASADMPLDRHPDPAEHSASLGQGLDRNNLIAITMDEEDRRPRSDVAGEMLRAGEEARKADDTGERTAAAQPNVKRHHRALAKAYQRKRIARKVKARKLAIQKRLKSRRRMAYAAPAFARVAKR